MLFSPCIAIIYLGLRHVLSILSQPLIFHWSIKVHGITDRKLKTKRYHTKNADLSSKWGNVGAVFQGNWFTAVMNTELWFLVFRHPGVQTQQDSLNGPDVWGGSKVKCTCNIKAQQDFFSWNDSKGLVPGIQLSTEKEKPKSSVTI